MTLAPAARRAVLPLLSLLPGVAFAHAGHETVTSFVAGLVHPLGGADHLLAMLAVGLWAATVLPAGRRWIAPLLFVGVMALAAALARSGLGLPAAGGLEPLLAGTVIALGALLVGGALIAPAAGLALTAAAGWLHGGAHGLEWGGSGPFAAHAAGFVLATLLLHGLGWGAGLWLQGHRNALARAGGALVSLAGLALLVARL